MWGALESASKNTSDPILKIRKERFSNLPLACDLALALRISAHNLFFERERYENPLIPRDERTCVYCSANFGSKKIEDELHVLVKCPL